MLTMNEFKFFASISDLSNIQGHLDCPTWLRCNIPIQNELLCVHALHSLINYNNQLNFLLFERPPSPLSLFFPNAVMTTVVSSKPAFFSFSLASRDFGVPLNELQSSIMLSSTINYIALEFPIAPQSASLSFRDFALNLI